LLAQAAKDRARNVAARAALIDFMAVLSCQARPNVKRAKAKMAPIGVAIMAKFT
jgi:hypothetical protein